MYDAKSKTIVTDSGDPGIAGPTKAMELIITATDAEYDFENDAYIASCRPKKTLSYLVFTFSDDEYTVPVS